MKNIEKLERINQQIIDALYKKIEKECSGAIDLIGIYGSFLTGDIHEKSDLDLMIVNNCDEGWRVATCAIIGDIGYDIYCTGWDSLEEESEFNSPYISKLLDSKIIYVREESCLEKLAKLQNKVRKTLSMPLNPKDLEKVEKELKEAKLAFADMNLAQSKKDVLLELGNVIYYSQNTLCLLNKTYFKLGTKKRYEELNALKILPKDFVLNTDLAVKADSLDDMKSYAGKLLSSLIDTVSEYQPKKEKAEPSQDDIKGSYEEFYSNWRNKVYQGAKTGDVYSIFDALVNLQITLKDISTEVNINDYDILSSYNVKELMQNGVAFDDLLQKYLLEYNNIGFKPKVYKDVEEFTKDYLK